MALKTTVLNSSIKKVKKVYHVSDIHFRNFKRHEEYRKVVNNLAEYIKSTKTDESIICITGDIVHSKTDITPELVQEVQSFLKLMSSLLPTIVIPGNHDANLNNNHRLDSLSPIINAINDSNIFFLKDTGVYEIGGIDFVHWSVFDDHKKYISASKVKSDCKICLYHGPVNGSTTEFDFKLLGNVISVSDFKGFDMVLLGDIHKTQYLDDSKTIAYPGSLIQNNHAESLVHGILLWDVDSRSSEFVEIKNDTCFYTIDIENGLYDEIPDSIPQNVYVRLRSKNTSHSRLKEIVSEIKSSRNVIELSNQTINGFSGKALQHQETVVNVRDVDFQNKIIVEHLKAKYDLPEEDVVNICDLNKQINSGIEKTEVTRNIQWNPKRFEFSNMFSYGEGNVIDMTNMSGIYGIFAANANGKSSAIESIVYCLFDKCSKTSKASMVMNNNARDFHCKIDFELNGKDYTIERAAKKHKSDHVSVNVDFYITESDGTKTSLNGKDRYDTNSIIRSYIGTYEDFILTSMSMQNNNTGFIDMGQTERKDLLSQFLDIKVFEDLFEKANEELKEYSILIKEYKKVDYFSKIKDIDSDIESHMKKHEFLLIEKSNVENELEDLKKQHLELSSKVVSVDSHIVDIETLEHNKKANERRIQTLKKDCDELEEKLLKLTNEITSLELEESQFNKEEIEGKILKAKQLIETEKQLSIKVERLKTEVSHKLEKMSKLEDLKYDENCKFCMENVFVKDAIQTKKSIEQDKTEAKKSVDQLKETRIEIQTLNSVIESYKAISSKLSLKKGEKLSFESSMHKTSLAMHHCETELKNDNIKIQQYKDKEEAIKSNHELFKQIESIKTKTSELSQKLKKLNDQIIECNSELQLCHKEKDIAQSSIERLRELETKFKYYEYYMSAVGRDGVPYELISAVIPKIQEDINNILSQIVDFQISIQSDGKNINAYLVYDDSKMWPIELSSGMEKFVSSLAIRSSLINITSLPRPSFLAIDEGWGSLDQSNMGNVSILLNYLKTQFKFILMISHIDSMRDVVDNHIEVVKTKDGVSSVTFP